MAAKKDSTPRIERSYNIPLRKSFRLTTRHKKTPRAVRAVKEFLAKHMKCENIKLGMHLNEHLWKHGIKNPPHHVKVHAVKEGDIVKAELEGFEFKEAVKSEPKKKEPTTMGEKLAEKLGAKQDKQEAGDNKKAGKDEGDEDTEEKKQEQAEPAAQKQSP